MKDWIEEFFSTIDHDKRMEILKANAQTLGKADKATLKFRKQCKELGAGVVFSNGLSREQTLDVLRSVEMQNIIKGAK